MPSLGSANPEAIAWRAKQWKSSLLLPTILSRGCPFAQAEPSILNLALLHPLLQDCPQTYHSVPKMLLSHIIETCARGAQDVAEDTEAVTSSREAASPSIQSPAHYLCALTPGPPQTLPES